jgi:hypothetical protein
MIHPKDSGRGGGILGSVCHASSAVCVRGGAAAGGMDQKSVHHAHRFLDGDLHGARGWLLRHERVGNGGEEKGKERTRPDE